MANKVLRGDIHAYRDVLSELSSLVDDDRIGNEINFALGHDGIVHAIPSVHNTEIIPKFRRKLRASGTLSESQMPKGQSNELYQDYVASVALKVAGDTFHVLPIDQVFVTCVADMLNSQTGHIEPTPILSVQFVRTTFKKLNLLKIDPSDSLRNFNHSMKFTKTRGFQKIESLVPMIALEE
jgi:DNA-binding LytR/AlgR family response regulator